MNSQTSPSWVDGKSSKIYFRNTVDCGTCKSIRHNLIFRSYFRFHLKRCGFSFLNGAPVLTRKWLAIYTNTLPDCFNDFFISFHVKIRWIQEEHFIFWGRWLFRIIQASTTITVHITTVNIHWYICICSQTGGFWQSLKWIQSFILMGYQYI